ncbi:MAG TPA: hydroxymethylbilane synthase [Dehalococcoidia bacterium]|nr:hydroxymethylbilane synthase [Dehalococcoidia bacterium]|tara:strand:- start:2074 stop:3012 length:939 start_codon:yes stop_codon:yes gene_type:complete
MMPTKKSLKIATRSSVLAMQQANTVKTALESKFSDYIFELYVVDSEIGDLNKDKPLAGLGLGVFVKSIEQALLNKTADIAVHSLKDVPTILTYGLEIVAYMEREDARDVLVSRFNCQFDKLPERSSIGTSSPRRTAQIVSERKDLEIIPIRGNVPTRLNKIQDLECDSVILAAAGLIRLGLEDKVTQYLPINSFIPAPGQGIIGVQIRSEDTECLQLVRQLDNKDSRACATAERTFLKLLGSGCQLPVGAHGVVKNECLELHVSVANIEEGTSFFNSETGDINNPEKLAKDIKLKLERSGAKEIINQFMENN